MMQDKVDQRREPYPDAGERMDKIACLMGGTHAMRKAGKTYLPQMAGEKDSHYRARTARTVLFNGFKKTVKDMAGKVFERPTEIEGSPEFEAYSEDIDMEGRDLNTFATDVFEAGLQNGIHFIMVDAPPKAAGETVGQAKAENRRPYFVEINFQSVLDWRTDRVNNKTMLSHFRYMESVEERDGEFGVKTIPQIRALDLMTNEVEEDELRIATGVRVTLYRRNENTGEWEVYGDPSEMDVEQIPIVPFYTNRTGFFKGEPPLEDLADLNIIHWQSSSDQRNILHWVRVPILFGAGVQTEGEAKVAAGTMMKASDPQAKLGYVEHSGAGIDAGQKDIEHLEFQMEVQGLQLLVAEGSKQTATGEAREDKKENSRLSTMADNLKDALTKAFTLMAEFGGTEFSGKVKVHKDFTIGTINAAALNALLAAVAAGKISKETFWSEMKRLGVLSEGFDPEEEAERLEEQAEKDMEAFLAMNPAGGSGDDEEGDDDPKDEDDDE